MKPGDIVEITGGAGTALIGCTAVIQYSWYNIEWVVKCPKVFGTFIVSEKHLKLIKKHRTLSQL